MTLQADRPESAQVLDEQWRFLDDFCQRQAERLRAGAGRDEDEQVPFELHAVIAQRELHALRQSLERLQRERDELADEVTWLRELVARSQAATPTVAEQSARRRWPWSRRRPGS